MLMLQMLLHLGAMTALALAMDRHHEDLRGRPPAPRQRRLLRGLALALMGLGLGLAAGADRPAQALVDWAVAATPAALAVVLALSVAPRRPRR